MLRFKAFALHLLLSLFLITTLIVLFMVQWFPTPFFFADGGWQAIRIVALVDVTLGPLLTLVVFNPLKPKKSLSIDLSVIAVAQLAALVFGLWTVFSVRTTTMVFADGTFYSLDAAAAQMLGEPYEEVAQTSGMNPVYIVIDLPNDVEERQEVRRKAMAMNRPLFQHSEYLILYGEAARDELFYTPPKLDMLLDKIQDGEQRLATFLDEHGAKRDDFQFYRVRCRFDDMLIAINPADLSVVGWIENIRSSRQP